MRETSEYESHSQKTNKFVFEIIPEHDVFDRIGKNNKLST